MYARYAFLPGVSAGQFSWFASIEGALVLATEILKPAVGLMWSRDNGGHFTISSRNPLERWSGSSGPHVSTDPLAIIDAAIAAEIDKRRSAVAHTWGA
ncbi:hypothetical protein ABID82_007121 [Methylobacterium sp. PvP062]|uniref:Uncharacterized protein n=1 Tax=Methylobacterium radiotolerans TaxID=31998 RepID=A0ABV2NKZ7_9HYPH|nr:MULTISPECIES: hypothetical protein [unclassified Methylobacterium]KZB99798.1 hypothetical protein AU375_04087 [Methylobacterium radiotolerans]MBP2496092.1 hypothetical protein [Methylobacterium sp. PvP105]MBP2504037.1 hypothetical protein [Methylobacterium sp. PvP109]